jgi:hypothetical protein
MLLQSARRSALNLPPLTLSGFRVVDRTVEEASGLWTRRNGPGKMGMLVAMAVSLAARHARGAYPGDAVGACKEARKAVEVLKDEAALTKMKQDFEEIKEADENELVLDDPLVE